MSTSSAIAIRDEQDEFDDRQVAILRNLGVEKANRGDLALFFHVCKRTGLDPFARQVYMIERWTKDGPKQSIQTGIDGFRLIAQRTVERTGETFGYEDTQWCGPDGQWQDVWLSPVPPSAARVAVIRNGQRFPSVALMSEYAQTKKDGSPTQMWATKGALMLAKCAEAGALRKAFPLDLSGLYTDDEMQQATGETKRAVKAQGMDAVRQAVAPEAPAPEQPAAANTDDVQDAEVVEETGEAINDGQRRAMFAAFSGAGFKTDARSAEGRQARLDYIGQIIGRTVESSNDLTSAEASRVIDALNQDAAESEGQS